VRMITPNRALDGAYGEAYQRWLEELRQVLRG
jgi:hypothetical protein